MSRKRHRDSFFNDDGDFSSKRVRPDRDTVESLLYRIGSKETGKIQKDISDLSILICGEVEKNPDLYAMLFASCAKNIPERMPIYTALLGLVNLRNHEFVIQTVNYIVRDLKDALRTSNFDDVKYLVRFFSNLVRSNVIHPANMLSLYENFAEVTLDVRASSQARTDWYSYVVLYTLPYSAQLLNDHNSASLNAILSTINVYLSKRQTLHVPMLRVWDTSDPHPQEDYLTCLWDQINSMKSANWKEHVLWAISDSFPALRESGQPCEFSQITPPDYDPEIVYPAPQVVFRMFDYTDVYSTEELEEKKEIAGDAPAAPASASRTLPGAHTVERFLVDEQIHIILETMNFNRTMCARALLNLQTRAKVAIDYMIVEAIFADIFRLPKPPVRHGNLLFYASLLIQLCNEAVNTMPLVLAQATETLFERLDTMKPVCTARFVEWFSFHLTNYQLKWSWQDWSRALAEPPMSPRRWFIAETLRRLIRYSFYDNVKQRIPRSFHCLLPPVPGPVNPYDEASPVKRRIFTRILEAFRGRRGPDDILDLVKRLAVQSDDTYDEDATSVADYDRSNQKGGRRNSGSQSSGTGEFDNKAPKDGRPRLTARRRKRGTSSSSSSSDSSSSSSSKSGSASASEQEANADEPMKAKEDRGGSKEPIVSCPPVAMEETPGNSDECLVPGVTSRELELFMTALLYRAHKTISHTCFLLKRYSEPFKKLASSVELQVEALHIVQAVWCNQTQMVVAVTNYMSRQGMLDPESVIGWGFSPYMSAFHGPLSPPKTVYIRPRMLELHVWECLMHVLVRAGQRVDQITPKLEAAKDGLGIQGRRPDNGSRSSASSSSDSDDDGAADNGDLRNKISRGRRQRERRKHRDARGDSSHSPSPRSRQQRHRHGDDVGVSGVARLEEERGEAVRSQCAVITLLLHRHVRLVALVEEVLRESAAPDDDLSFVGYWLKGRLMQTVLEHQDQFLPYMDNLEKLMVDVSPFVSDLFQALRSLYA